MYYKNMYNTNDRHRLVYRQLSKKPHIFNETPYSDIKTVELSAWSTPFCWCFNKLTMRMSSYYSG